MEKVSLDEPEEIRNYLKENMAEGYLSKGEGLNIDKFVDRYKQLMNSTSRAEKLVRKSFENKVI